MTCILLLYTETVASYTETEREQVKQIISFKIPGVCVRERDHNLLTSQRIYSLGTAGQVTNSSSEKYEEMMIQ